MCFFFKGLHSTINFSSYFATKTIQRKTIATGIFTWSKRGRPPQVVLHYWLKGLACKGGSLFMARKHITNKQFRSAKKREVIWVQPNFCFTFYLSLSQFVHFQITNVYYFQAIKYISTHFLVFFFLRSFASLGVAPAPFVPTSVQTNTW